VPNRLNLWGRLSYDHLLSGHEERFFASTKQVPLISFVELAVSDDIPDTFPIADLFPVLARTAVSPGDIFNATVGLDVKLNKRWSWKSGYDFYRQGREKINKISLDTIDLSKLIIEDSISSQVTQHKLFSELSFVAKTKHRDWHLGFGGDYSFANKGIAKDWTLHGKIGITF
jgi:hypothetical protein